MNDKTTKQNVVIISLWMWLEITLKSIECSSEIRYFV